MKNLMTYFTLLFFFVTTTALAAVITDDKVELGKPSSTADKQVVFSGPTKKKLTHKNATNTLEYDGNNLTVGDGANSSKVLKFNKGASSPEIRYNSSTSKLEFSNDASVYKAIGSGSGAGSGINLLDNAGFEDGVAVSWTSSGTSLVEANTGANLLYELKSATWTPTATAHFFESTAVTVPNILYGQECMIKMNYKGGDANAYMTVMDGSSVELIPTASRLTLNSAAGVKTAKVYFVCPSTGSIKIRVQSTGAMAIASFDQAHLGQADFYGVAAISDWQTWTPTGSWTSNAVYTGKKRRVGDSYEYDVNVTLTGTPSPNVTLNINLLETIDTSKLTNVTENVDLGNATITDSGVSNYSGRVRYASTTAVNIYIENAAGSFTVPMNMDVTSRVAVSTGDTIHMNFKVPVVGIATGEMSVNAKCPNDIACENYFTAFVSSTGVVSSENLDWINGNCVVTSTSTYTCTFNSSIFTQFPICTATASSLAFNQSQALGATTSNVQVVLGVNGAAQANSFYLACQKSTVDYKAKQNIQGFLSSTVTSASNNIRIEYIAFGGGSMGANCTTTPCTIFANSGPFVSVTRGGTGLYTLNITAGTFSAYPICTTRGFLNGATGNANLNASGSGQDLFNPVNSNAINFGLFNAQTAALADGSGIITCVGPR